VAEHAPDVVVHVGDPCLDGTHHPEDLDFAREQLDRLPAPWVSIPGNHDIGDNPGPASRRMR
jgi:3',5'-cyclic AMP phosphodiesterase CpdA